MKKIFVLIVFLLSFSTLFSQKMISKKSYVHIYSYTPIEDIDASLNDGLAILSTDTKEVAYILNIQSLTFKNALMQEHFNENYIESEKFPKATLIGSLSGDVNFSKTGIYNLSVKGKLKMHGVEQVISVPIELNILEDLSVSLKTDFLVKLEDFGIRIPKLMFTRIAEEIKVSVESKFLIQ
ncbi:MAG: Uncharacterised protein [Owenweeksia sp. TMED14]|nr:MAG: Uncharacterised protein [Owenweeksia sp. TMED14]